MDPQSRTALDERPEDLTKVELALSMSTGAFLTDVSACRCLTRIHWRVNRWSGVRCPGILHPHRPF